MTDAELLRLMAEALRDVTRGRAVVDVPSCECYYCRSGRALAAYDAEMARRKEADSAG